MAESGQDAHTPAFTLGILARLSGIGRVSGLQHRRPLFGPGNASSASRCAFRVRSDAVMMAARGPDSPFGILGTGVCFGLGQVVYDGGHEWRQHSLENVVSVGKRAGH